MALTSLGLACMPLSQEANQLQVLFPAQECIAYMCLSVILLMHIMQVEQYGEEYQSQSWGPLITLVKGSSPPAGGSVTSAKDKATIKETLLTVNGYIQVCCILLSEPS